MGFEDGVFERSVCLRVGKGGEVKCVFMMCFELVCLSNWCNLMLICTHMNEYAQKYA